MNIDKRLSARCQRLERENESLRAENVRLSIVATTGDPYERGFAAGLSDRWWNFVGAGVFALPIAFAVGYVFGMTA